MPTDLTSTVASGRAIMCFAAGDQKTPRAVIAHLQSRLRQMIGQKLREMPEDHREFLTSVIGIEKKVIEELLEWQKSALMISSVLFDSFACPLGICISEVFGRPVLKEGDRTFFEAQMRSTGFVAGHMLPHGNLQNPEKIDSVPLFVLLSAIDEMDAIVANPRDVSHDQTSISLG
jgi:hypothetical protein